MLEGPVGSTLLRLALPMMMGIVSVMLINIVDTFYIGQLGVRELAAISFAFPVISTLMSLVFGVGIGTSAVLSRAIGKGHLVRVRQLTTHSLLLIALGMVFISFLGIMTLNPLFRAMGAEEDLIPLIHEYMFIWYLGVGLVAIPIVGNSAIRASGDSITPSLVMMMAAIINAVLDPLLIFGLGPFPQMGIQGAAVATVISYCCALMAGLWVLGRKKDMLDLSFPSPKRIWESWKHVLYIGLPAGLTSMLAPVSTAVLTRMVSDYGEDAVAAFGVGTRLESLATIGMMALSAILTPFIGQNLGAGNQQRIFMAMKYITRFSITWGILACIILAAVAVPLATLFSESKHVQDLISSFLWIVPISYGFYGMAMLAVSACNGLQKPIQATAINLMRLFLLILPLSWFGSWGWGLIGLFVGLSAGNMFSGTIAMFWVRKRMLPQIKAVQRYPVT